MPGRSPRDSALLGARGPLRQALTGQRWKAGRAERLYHPHGQGPAWWDHRFHPQPMSKEAAGCREAGMEWGSGPAPSLPPPGPEFEGRSPKSERESTAGFLGGE